MVQLQRAYGRISHFQQGRHTKTNTFVMVVDVRFDNEPSEVLRGSYERVFLLGHQPCEVAMLYGDDLNGLPCVVEYYGNQPDQGIAYIVNTRGEGDLLQASNMRGFGTLFAPAG